MNVVTTLGRGKALGGWLALAEQGKGCTVAAVDAGKEANLKKKKERKSLVTAFASSTRACAAQRHKRNCNVFSVYECSSNSYRV